MKNLEATIQEIYNAADQQAVEAIIEQAEEINSLLDEARDSMSYGQFASAYLCAGAGLEGYEQMLSMSERASNFVIKAALLDALGTVKLDKFDFPAEVADRLLLRKKAAVRLLTR